MKGIVDSGNMCIRRKIDARRRRKCGVTLCDLMGSGHLNAITLSLLGMLRLVKLPVVGILMMKSFHITLPRRRNEVFALQIPNMLFLFDGYMLVRSTDMDTLDTILILTY
jgi:hypothetical protein